MLKQTALLEQDSLSVSSIAGVFCARRGKGFIRRIAVARVCRIHASQHQLQCRSREVISPVRGDQRTAARLGVKLQDLCPFVSGKYIAHPDRPDLPADARKRDIFDIQPAIEKEREPRPKYVHFQAMIPEIIDISETIRQSVGRLLNWSRAGFRDVVSADRDRIPTRHLSTTITNHVCQKPERWLDWKNQLILGLNF